MLVVLLVADYDLESLHPSPPLRPAFCDHYPTRQPFVVGGTKACMARFASHVVGRVALFVPERLAPRSSALIVIGSVGVHETHRC